MVKLLRSPHVLQSTNRVRYQRRKGKRKKTRTGKIKLRVRSEFKIHKHTQRTKESLLKYLCIQISNHRSNSQCTKASAFIAARSQWSQLQFSGRRNKGSGTRKLVFNGKIQNPHWVFRKPGWTRTLVLYSIFAWLMFITWPFFVTSISVAKHNL